MKRLVHPLNLKNLLNRINEGRSDYSRLEGYKAPQHCAVQQWSFLWSDRAPSSTFGMSWCDVCDPEQIIQHQHLTSLTTLWPYAIKS